MNLKLGKLPAKQDSRNIKFRTLLPDKLPPIPSSYDVDMDNYGVWPLPLPMFANDKWGCCVIAGRANQTLRFEKIEQGQDLDITDQDVLSEYWAEQGDPSGKAKPDDGLYVLESLKSWRSNGWQAGGKHYDIYAFAEINKDHMKEIQAAIYLLGGAVTGVTLHEGDMAAIENHKVWDTDYPAGEIVGGHCMYIVGFFPASAVFLTWGQRQVATWDWVLSRVDEVYGVVDNRDRFLGDRSPVDVDTLDAYLKRVAS